jgi:hypothetical protein
MVVADMCFPVNLLAKFQATFLSKALRLMNPNQLLIELTCPVMQAAKRVHISLIHRVLAHDLRVEAEVKIPLEEIVFIGSLASKAMDKDYGTLVFPEVSRHVQVATH